MSIKTILVALTITLSVLSCDNNKQEVKVEEKRDTIAIVEPSEAEQWIADAIEAHGGEKYKTAHYSFDFRGKQYSFKNESDKYVYQMKDVDDDGNQLIHTIENGNYSLKVEGEEFELPEEDIKKFKNALNSVIYFVNLPYKLQDKAVIADQKGETFINDTAYQLIVVNFEQENGGQDFEDQYMYWINKETKQVDYLAYNFKENKGGARFRKAYNRRVVDGILFQDYINYKAARDIDLYMLAELYEKGELEELSRIKTENVKALE